MNKLLALLLAFFCIVPSAQAMSGFGLSVGFNKQLVPGYGPALYYLRMNAAGTALEYVAGGGGGGGVSNVAIGDLSPLFTTIVTDPTGSASAAYTLSNAAANTAFGNFTGSSAAPSFTAASTVRSSLSCAVLGTNNDITSMTALNSGGIPNAAIAGLAASATTDALNASNISSGTLPAAQLPNPSSSTLGGVQSKAAASNEFLTSISTSGVPASAQPAFTNISGQATTAQLPTLTSTNLFVGNGSNVATGVAMSGDATMANTGSVTLATVPVAKGGTGNTYGGAQSTGATLTGTTTLTATSAGVVECDASGGAFTVTLPLASTCAGKTFSFLNASTGIVTVNTNAADVINKTETSFTIASALGGVRTLTSDGGTKWISPLPAFTGISLSAGTILYAAAGAIKVTAQGLTGQVFTSAGTGTPVFSTVLANSTGVSLPTAGQGFLIKEGSNCTMGVATLVAGTVTVSTTKVTANSRIFLTPQTSGGTPGFVGVSARSAGTSFTITGVATDTSDIAWMIVEPL